ncbi:MAG: hypothetical protein ABI402_07350 [Ferruginibacter sp.]
MKFNKMKILSPLLLVGVLSFSLKNEIGNCFISFNKASNLQLSATERLPQTADRFRKVKTAKGEVAITRIDGYRVLYNNKKQVPFVNLKIEQSNHGSYGADTLNIIENLKFLNASTPMETKDILQLNYNGYNIYGLSRKSVENGTTLGIFAIFAGNDVIAYIYFNNLKPEVSNFTDLEDYKKQRNLFLQEYTSHLKNCLGK